MLSLHYFLNNRTIFFSSFQLFNLLLETTSMIKSIIFIKMLFSAIKKPFCYLVLIWISVSSLSVLEVHAQDKAVQLFAHRAGAHEQDENTLEAFRNTYDQ